MALHQIEPTRATLHGHFSPELPPILTINPGDTVRYRTLDAGWGLEPQRADGSPRQCFTPRNPTLDDGHAMCGPLFVQGAQPGMTLEVQIGPIIPGPWGLTLSGGDWLDLNHRLGLANERAALRWTLDASTMTGQNHLGHTIPLHPFLGVLGMPPPDPGVHATTPPRPWGGNLDCKELVAGTSLYLPISVPGALFSCGDGHGAQGDGEVSGLAIECPMDQVDLTFYLHADMPLQWPRARTPTHWITFGLHPDLNEATALALENMLDLMTTHTPLTRLQALAYASLLVDLRITQVVNQTKGVHAMLALDALKSIA